MFYWVPEKAEPMVLELVESGEKPGVDDIALKQFERICIGLFL